MIIIFGIKKRVKDHGVVEKFTCTNCNNESGWSLIKTHTWFTLFWIPVFPINFPEYFLMCPICRGAVTLDKDGKEKYLRIYNINKEYLAGKITDEEFRERMNGID